MKTLARFGSLSEAVIFVGMLESSGIRVYQPDEFTSQNTWFLIHAMGGIRVQVDEADWELASTILDDYYASTEKPLEIKCPACGAVEAIRADTWRNLAIAVLVLLNLPIPWRTTYHCKCCGHRWNL